MLLRFHPGLSMKNFARYNLFKGGGWGSVLHHITYWDSQYMHFVSPHHDGQGADDVGKALDKMSKKRPYLYSPENDTIVLGTDHPNCFSVWRQTPSTTRVFRDADGNSVTEQDPLELLKYDLNDNMYYRDPKLPLRFAGDFGDFKGMFDPKNRSTAAVT
jgi:hypothetical protein